MRGAAASSDAAIVAAGSEDLDLAIEVPGVSELDRLVEQALGIALPRDYQRVMKDSGAVLLISIVGLRIAAGAWLQPGVGAR